MKATNATTNTDKFARYISSTPKCEIVTLDKPLVDWLLEMTARSNRGA